MPSSTAKGHTEVAHSYNAVPNKASKVTDYRAQLRWLKENYFFIWAIGSIGWFVFLILVSPLILLGYILRKVFDQGWQLAVSDAVVKVLLKYATPLRAFGEVLEWAGNRFAGQYKPTTGKLIDRTMIGLLDTDAPALRKTTVELFPSPTPSSRPNGDVCVTAAKIIYEKRELVEDVINNVWNTQVVVEGTAQKLRDRLADGQKFEFVKWFSYKTQSIAPDNRGIETEAMIFRKWKTTKDKDGNDQKCFTIVVVFRGTEPFSAVDWATDFYFPWYEMPALGRVHTGFLQALGLGFPNDGPPPGAHAKLPQDKHTENKKLDKFSDYIATCMSRFSAVAERSTLTGEVPKAKRAHFADLEARRKRKKDDFMNEFVLKTKKDRSQEESRGGKVPKAEKAGKKKSLELKPDAPLYWQIRNTLRELLDEDPNAQVFITGHSLGGALAALFTGLVAAESDAITQRIGGLFTFGQPRIGDWTFAWFLHSRLNGPQHRYVRMIYGHDLVPHVPFDTDIFEFKHLGPYHWVDPFYHIRIGTFEDQPPLNVFKAHLNGIVELIYNAFWTPLINDFRTKNERRSPEGLLQTLSRAAVLLLPFLPMLGAHSPVNYVNAVRYGMPEGKAIAAPEGETHAASGAGGKGRWD